MVPIVCRPKIFTICSRNVPALMLFDPNNSQLRVKNEHSMHEKSICRRKLRSYKIFLLCNSPEKKKHKAERDSLTMFYAILVARTANEKKYQAIGETEH